MARKKGRDEVEELRGRLREAQKQIKELKKVLGRLQKQSHRVEELEELFQEIEDENDNPPTPVHNRCDCGGKIEKVDLGVRILSKCNNCGKRETKKK